MLPNLVIRTHAAQLSNSPDAEQLIVNSIFIFYAIVTVVHTRMEHA